MKLVVNSEGVYLTKVGECFCLKKEGQKQEIAAKKVEQIIITTSTALSTDAIELAVENNIDIVFLKKYGKAIRTQLFRWFPDLVLTGLIVAGVCYVYGYNVVTVFGYKASDVPVHNLWINNMSNNQIFSKGVYPYGFHCVIYYLHTAFGIKTYILLRVFGLVQTLFIHLALLISLKVICKARYTPYFGTAAYLMLKIYSPGSYVRLLSALPQEYGMLFIFPAAVLAIRFLQEYTKHRSEQEVKKKQWQAKRVKGYLAGFAISFSLTLTVHFYDTIPTGVLCVGIAAGFCSMLFKWRYFWRIMLAGIISVVLALVPMVAGVITGHPLEGSLYWALGVISGEENSSQGQNNDNVTTVIDKNGNVVLVEQLYRENLGDESVKVYNFQVEEYHTYFVGRTMILVHNAKYDVGKYNEMPNEPGMDKHHVPQKAVMKKLDPNYDPSTGPSIKVPKEGHTIKGPRGIVSRSTKGINSPSELIMRDINELRRVYPDIPESSINKLINMFKEMGYKL